VRVLVDYRPALKERSGVGEYVHQFVRALLAAFPHGDARQAASVEDGGLDLALFSSSWKDRFTPFNEIAGATAVDRRVPGKLLNFAWHRLGWPPAELIAGRSFDVTHSLHPLLLPAQNSAQVVTIHDLDFLTHPERTRAEIRRDYPALAREHARRADGIIVISEFTKREVERQLGIAPDRISVCTPGAPPWTPRSHAPSNGYVLFVGTLEPRKNVGGLLDAYEQLVTRRNDVPRLVLAGKALPEAGPWLERLTRPPLHGRVEHIGYVEAPNRRALYEGARLLVQPSFDEGFGIPVLEAMTLGVPVVASNRGALPEVVGDAGPLVDPEADGALSAAIEQLIDDEEFTAICVAKGLTRSRLFSWDQMARGAYAAYRRAIDRRCVSA
jgi:glycosyltransferase involved in cell wall biosynthesis